MDEKPNYPDLLTQLDELVLARFPETMTAALRHQVPHANPVDIEDAVGEAFVKTVAARLEDPPEDLRGYLIRASRNALTDLLRRRTERDLRECSESKGLYLTSQGESPPARVERQWLRRFLLDVVAGFSSDRLRLVTEIYIEGAFAGESLTANDVQEVIEINTGEAMTPDAVRKAKIRGFAQLARDLDGMDETTHLREGGQA